MIEKPSISYEELNRNIWAIHSQLAEYSNIYFVDDWFDTAIQGSLRLDSDEYTKRRHVFDMIKFVIDVAFNYHFLEKIFDDPHRFDKSNELLNCLSQTISAVQKQFENLENIVSNLNLEYWPILTLTHKNGEYLKLLEHSFTREGSTQFLDKHRSTELNLLNYLKNIRDVRKQIPRLRKIGQKKKDALDFTIICLVHIFRNFHEWDKLEDCNRYEIINNCAQFVSCALVASKIDIPKSEEYSKTSRFPQTNRFFQKISKAYKMSEDYFRSLDGTSLIPENSSFSNNSHKLFFDFIRLKRISDFD